MLLDFFFLFFRLLVFGSRCSVLFFFFQSGVLIRDSPSRLFFLVVTVSASVSFGTPLRHPCLTTFCARCTLVYTGNAWWFVASATHTWIPFNSFGRVEWRASRSTAVAFDAEAFCTTSVAPRTSSVSTCGSVWLMARAPLTFFIACTRTRRLKSTLHKKYPQNGKVLLPVVGKHPRRTPYGTRRSANKLRAKTQRERTRRARTRRSCGNPGTRAHLSTTLRRGFQTQMCRAQARAQDSWPNQNHCEDGAQEIDKKQYRTSWSLSAGAFRLAKFVHGDHRRL